MAEDLLRHFFGGFVRMHVLYHAAKEPVWGAAIIAELERHGYRLTPGTLYPILHQLETAGYLTARTAVVAGKRRKNYRITRSGRLLLHNARGKLRELVSEVLEDQDRMRPIGLLDAKGKMEPLPVPKARYANPRVSPDGKRLAVTIEEGTSTNISIYEWAAQRLARFPFPNGGSEKPLWTPDGKYLAFYSDARTPGPGIYLMRADGTGMPQRLVEGSDLSPASFSYNSARLAYQVERGSNRGAWILPLDWSDAAHPKPGVPERFDAGDAPIFSHDKQWLAYEGSIAGTPELFVLPIPGPGGPWQISASGIAPVWSRTGPEIFYQNVHDETVMVTRYSIIGGSLSSARPRQWNPMRATLLGFDLMPDGKRIVIIPAAGQIEPTHATFLLNFIDDLRRRLPPAR